MFTFQHLKEINIGYIEHAKMALRLSGSCLKASAALCIHALYPDILVETGTKSIREGMEKYNQSKSFSSHVIVEVLEKASRENISDKKND